LHNRKVERLRKNNNNNYPNPPYLKLVDPDNDLKPQPIRDPWEHCVRLDDMNVELAPETGIDIGRVFIDRGGVEWDCQC
jgi:hypothetical protein